MIEELYTVHIQFTLFGPSALNLTYKMQYNATELYN